MGSQGVIDLCSSDEEDVPKILTATQAYHSTGLKDRAQKFFREAKRQRTGPPEATSTVGPSATQSSNSFSFGRRTSLADGPQATQPAATSLYQLTSTSDAQPAFAPQGAASPTPAANGGLVKPSQGGCAQNPAIPAGIWGLMKQKQPLPEVTHVSDTVVASEEAAPVTTDGPAVGSMGRLDDSEASSPQLSGEQAEVLRAVQEGKNVFFTGNAGTGKSFLLTHILADLRSTYGYDFGASVAICASTGIAATHVGGTTLHSAFGIGIPKTSEDFGRAWKQENRKRIRAWKVMVVDEISMVSGELFEHLEQTTRDIKGVAEKPFGGLQLVLCGDYFQLPPIPERASAGPGGSKDRFGNRCFTFEAPAWRKCKFEQRVLTQVFRQKDMRFVNILEAVRYNENAEAALQDLMSFCHRPLEAKQGVEPTHLYSRNADVNALNTQRLQSLPGDPVVLKADDSVSPINLGDQDQTQRLHQSAFFKDCLATEKIQLKVGAQVMLLWNVDLDGDGNRMLVNGSRGVVTKFVSRDDERVKDGIREPEHLARWNGRQLPVVRFLNGREEIIGPEKFTSDFTGLGTCIRIQIPIKLAWAVTVHKSQGMTLDFVRVSLQNIFAEGQAYVALSRARTLEGLEITAISPGCVKTSPLVKKFHRCLLEGEEFEESTWDSVIGATSPPPKRYISNGSPSRPSFKRPAGHSQHSSYQSGGRFGSQGGGRQGQSKGECFKCGQSGHWARDCKQR